jgi:hypothetical protein
LRRAVRGLRRRVPATPDSFSETGPANRTRTSALQTRAGPSRARAQVRAFFSESLNHSAIVNPKLREIHRLLGRQRVSGRDDLEVFGRRGDNPDFSAVLTTDCRPPATGLALVSVDNVSLIIDPHGVSSYASLLAIVGCRSKFARTGGRLASSPAAFKQRWRAMR